MPQIVYFTDGQGRLCARWPGKSTYVKGLGSRKVGQQHLGLVVNKEKNIFWNRTQGFFIFDTETQTYVTPSPDDVPEITHFQPDRRTHSKLPIYIDFGDAFFLDQLIKGIGYDQVINQLDFANKDTLYALIQYYTLEGRASTQALTWYRSSYAAHLYPRANLSTQRISDCLKALGKPENRRAFLVAHIKYVLESTNENVCVLIDSTALPNNCDIPITCISNHEGEIDLAFRLIAVVQKKTGLPLFYEVIAGNIVDITTLEHTIVKLGNYGMRVDYVIGDAGYCCPSLIERLLLHGIDFMTRLAPQYNLFKNAVKEHLKELDDVDAVKYKGRSIKIIKFSQEIVKDTETGEIKSCFIYLCRDILSFLTKSQHLYHSRKAEEMTSAELSEASKRLGLFAIITTKDLSIEEILPEYYIRQAIEQYFDSGKNCGNFLPIRQHDLISVNGHLLLSFISTFLIILIKNRLNIVDTSYVCVAQKLFLDTPEGLTSITLEDCSKIKNKDAVIIEQDPLKDIFSESPSDLFLSLRGLKAEVFDTVIQPDVAQKDQREFLEAFGFANPTQISRLPERLLPIYKNEPKGHARVLAFTYHPPMTDEEILKHRKEKESKKRKNRKKTDASEDTEGQPSQSQRGRKKGTKGK